MENFLRTYPREERRYVERDKEDFYETTRVLSDSDFRSKFRMDRATFQVLCRRLRPYLSVFAEDEGHQELQHLNSHRLQLEVRIAIFLRIMAGGYTNDISMTYKTGISTCYSLFYSVLEALIKEFQFDGFPRDEESLRHMAAEFAESRPRSNPLPGCVGALDGISIKVVKPRKELNPLQFFCRKGYYSLPVQAIVDANYRFVAASAMCVGSTHDSLAFQLSGMGRFIACGGLPKGYWIAADDAYGCSEQVINPFGRSTASKYLDSFNFFHSSHRIHVEPAFGMITSRWGILGKPLSFEMRVNTAVVPAAMLLHNFIFDCEGPVRKRWRAQHIWDEAYSRLDEWLTWMRTDEDAGCRLQVVIEHQSPSAANAEKRFKLRCRLVAILRREAVLRPEAHSRFPGAPTLSRPDV